MRTVVGLIPDNPTNLDSDEELVLEDTATVTWDTTTPGVIKATAISSGGGVDTGITQLTGDVTAGPGSGSQAATITPYPLLDHQKHSDTTASSPTTGDLIYANSTPEWDDLAIGTSGQILTVVSGLPSWQTYDTGDPGLIPTIRRKTGYWIPLMGSTSGVANVGIGACSVNGSASSSNADIDFRHAALAAASGSVANFRNNFTSGGPKIRQKGTQSLQGQVGEGAGDAAKYRFVFGAGDINSATHFNTINCNAAGGTDNVIGFWMCYEDSIQANWQLCSGDGADWDCTDTGLTRHVGGTTFELILDMRDNTQLFCYIDGVKYGPHTNKLPSTTSNQASSPSIEIRSTAITSGGVSLKLGVMTRSWD